MKSNDNNQEILTRRGLLKAASLTSAMAVVSPSVALGETANIRQKLISLQVRSLSEHKKVAVIGPIGGGAHDMAKLLRANKEAMGRECVEISDNDIQNQPMPNNFFKRFFFVNEFCQTFTARIDQNANVEADQIAVLKAPRFWTKIGQVIDHMQANGFHVIYVDSYDRKQAEIQKALMKRTKIYATQANSAAIDAPSIDAFEASRPDEVLPKRYNSSVLLHRKAYKKIREVSRVKANEVIFWDRKYAEGIITQLGLRGDQLWLEPQFTEASYKAAAKSLGFA